MRRRSFLKFLGAVPAVAVVEAKRAEPVRAPDWELDEDIDTTKEHIYVRLWMLQDRLDELKEETRHGFRSIRRFILGKKQLGHYRAEKLKSLAINGYSDGLHASYRAERMIRKDPTRAHLWEQEHHYGVPVELGDAYGMWVKAEDSTGAIYGMHPDYPDLFLFEDGAKRKKVVL